MRGDTIAASTLRALITTFAATLAVSLPLLSDQQHIAVIATLTLAVLATGAGVLAFGSSAPQLAAVRLGTGYRIPATPSWMVTQVPCTPARPRAPARR